MDTHHVYETQVDVTVAALVQLPGTSGYHVSIAMDLGTPLDTSLGEVARASRKRKREILRLQVAARWMDCSL